MKFLFWFLFLTLPLAADFPIIGEGTTHITYVNEESKELHSITCHEEVELDFNFNYLQCLSRPGPGKKQIHFHDALHDLYSDHLRATYVVKDGTLELDKLKIYGNVCLIIKETPEDILAFDEMQYALADQMEYDYKNDKILLKSKENAHVLYYDPNHNYRISAQEITMIRDQKAEFPKVEGSGRVRFTFQEDELQKFKAQFSGKTQDFS